VKVAGLELDDARPVAGGDICRALSGRLRDGSPVFAKTLADPPPDFFVAEARGLDLIRVAGGPPVPEVRAVGDDGLVLEWIEPGSPGRDAAERFGAELAALHRAGGDRFGADGAGFVGSVPVDNAPADRWPSFFAERRLAPALDAAIVRGSVTDDEAAAIRTVIDDPAVVAGDPEPPARIHGDLWAGNLLWSANGRVWLVDAAAAHDGHRETDLAMLALFGAPYLDEIVAAYQREFPLAAGWQDRVPLHQLHPLLVHAIVFGGGYGARAAAAARRLLG
jgi:fructosamine-3-kinase